MSIGAELGQYILQTHNSKTFWRFKGGEGLNPPTPSGYASAWPPHPGVAIPSFHHYQGEQPKSNPNPNGSRPWEWLQLVMANLCEWRLVPLRGIVPLKHVSSLPPPDRERQDYRIGTARKMSVDIDATPDPLLLILQKLRIVQYRYSSLSQWNSPNTNTVWRLGSARTHWGTKMLPGHLSGLATIMGAYILLRGGEGKAGEGRRWKRVKGGERGRESYDLLARRPWYHQVYRWFEQSTIRARAKNIHRIARIISYIARIINVITLSSVNHFNKAGAHCSTNLALLKCWNCVIFTNK